MARLNEAAPPPVESVDARESLPILRSQSSCVKPTRVHMLTTENESVKRRFVRQNRELTKSVFPLLLSPTPGNPASRSNKAKTHPQSKHHAIPPHPHPRARDLTHPLRKPLPPLPNHRPAAPIPPTSVPRARRPGRQEPARDEARGTGQVSVRIGRFVGCGSSGGRCCEKQGPSEVAGSEELEKYTQFVGCCAGAWTRAGGEWAVAGYFGG